MNTYGSSTDELAAKSRVPVRLANTGKVLIMKAPSPRRTALANYWSTTCLTITWKVLSGVRAVNLQSQMGKYMSTAEKDIGNNIRGSKHQLLIIE